LPAIQAGVIALIYLSASGEESPAQTHGSDLEAAVILDAIFLLLFFVQTWFVKRTRQDAVKHSRGNGSRVR